jgi:hypothetical protein
MRRIRDRIKGWRRRFFGGAGEDEAGNPLREFVYLDEVSVYSLIASQTGAIAAEFTESESEVQRAKVAASGGANAGVARGEISSGLESEQSRGSQVLRKSIVQTTFGELVGLERVDLALRADEEEPERPVRDVAALAGLIAERGQGRDPWIIDPAELRRGQLLEVEVELEAESIYRVRAILGAMIEMLAENSEADPMELPGMGETMTGARILEKLLVGLVPLRGRAINYRHVYLDGKEWIVHERLVGHLHATPRMQVSPLHLVGVAEADLFWLDLRRVLFAHSRYLVMCRLGRDGVNDRWTPVKMVDLLQEMLPGIALMLDQMVELMSTIGRAQRLQAQGEPRREMMRAALVSFGEELAKTHDGDTSADELCEAGLLGTEQCDSFEDLKKRRAAFEAIAVHLREKLGFEEDRVLEGTLRANAMADAGLDLNGSAMAVAQSGHTAPVDPKGHFLDAEIVAIYW